MGGMFHIIGGLIHIMGDLIRLFHISLTTKQLLNTLNNMNHHILVLSQKMKIGKIDYQIICQN